MSSNHNAGRSSLLLKQPKRRAPGPTILQDVVSQVWEKVWGSDDDAATPNHRAERKPILDAAREALRLLEMKASLGALGKKNKSGRGGGGGGGGDRQEIRAAILLDIVLQSKQQQDKQTKQLGQTLSISTISTKEIAQKMGVNHASFQELQEKVRNYYYVIQEERNKRSQASKQVARSVQPLINTKTRGPLIGKSALLQSSVAHRPQRPQRNMTCDSLLLTLQGKHPDNIVPDLVVRLALYLRDPAAMLQSTVTALKNFLQYTKKQAAKMPTTQQRLDYEYDVRRFWPAYQAAMFYHLVTGSSSLFKHDAKTTGRKSNSTASKTSSHDEEEGSNTLTVEILVQASSTFTYMEVKEKIPFVHQWYEDTKEEREKSHKPKDTIKEESNKVVDESKTPARKRKGESVKGNEPLDKSCGKKTKTSGALRAFQVNTFSLEDSDFVNDPENNDHDMNEREKAETFASWKSTILDAACNKFVPTDQTATNQLDRHQALELAANEVLAKYGLSTT